MIRCQGWIHLTPQLFVDIAKAINGHFLLFEVIESIAEAERGVTLMKKNGLAPDAMQFFVMPTNTMWFRNYAPISLRYEDNSVVMVDAKY